MEAFSYGIPAIATAVGGMPEIVTEDCGVLLEAGFEPEELATVLEEWDVTDTARRDAALDKQRTEYSSIRNELKFALDIAAGIWEVAQFAVMFA